MRLIVQLTFERQNGSGFLAAFPPDSMHWLGKIAILPEFNFHPQAGTVCNCAIEEVRDEEGEIKVIDIPGRGECHRWTAFKSA